MSKKLYEEASVQAIADAIRDKCNTTDTMTVAEMPDYINNISSGGANIYSELPIEYYVPRSFLNASNASISKAYCYLTPGTDWVCNTIQYNLAGATSTVTVDGETYTVGSGYTSGSHQLEVEKYGYKMLSLSNSKSTPCMGVACTTAVPCAAISSLNVGDTCEFSEAYSWKWFNAVQSGTALYTIPHCRNLFITTSTVLSITVAPGSQRYIALDGIYVPDNLVSSYKSATNWSYLADFIHPISSYPYVNENL